MMDTDTLDQLSEISGIYHNLLGRNKETIHLNEALITLERIVQQLSAKLEKEIANG